MDKIKITLGCLILAFCGLLLPSCSAEQEEKTPVTLNAENFSDYIVLNVNLEDFENRTQIGILGTEYEGIAQLHATASLRKEVEIDSLTIKGRIATNGFCWTFNVYDFVLDFNKDGEAESVSTIYSGQYLPALPDQPTIGIPEVLKTGLRMEGITLETNEFIISTNSNQGIAIRVEGTIYE